MAEIFTVVTPLNRNSQVYRKFEKFHYFINLKEKTKKFLDLPQGVIFEGGGGGGVQGLFCFVL